MAYQWDSNLETGYTKIDKQHKQLFAALNNLIEVSAAGGSDTAVLETLDFLEGYTVKHFTDEEELQKEYNYPENLNHKRLHDDFQVAIKELCDWAIKDGPSEEVIGSVSSIIGSWLINHIRGDDFRMAAFVKAASGEN